MVPCKCGCGEMILGYAADGHKNRPVYYKYGHSGRGKNNPNYGKTMSEEQKIKISESKKGKSTGRINEKHPLWKEDEVGYFGLHKWIRRHFPRPIDGKCEFCHHKPFKEAACVTGIYNRDFKNWKWLCKSCHNTNDRIGGNFRRENKRNWEEAFRRS